MKITYILISSGIVLATSLLATAQSTFQDLDFNSAGIPPSTPFPSFVPITEALPGWSAEFINTSTLLVTPQTQVAYEGISVGTEDISLIDANVPGAPAFGGLAGNGSAVLLGGGPPSVISASISQTGIVSIGTQSIELEGSVSGAQFVVSLDGTTVDMVPLQTFVNYQLWGGNIPSMMAGQTETLTITEPPATSTQPSALELDDISFSPNPITVTPEPDALTLMGVGGLVFGLYRRIQAGRK
jgi:hypothetical protein